MSKKGEKGALSGQILPQTSAGFSAGFPQERKRTKKLEKTLPKGIYLGSRNDGREKPFYVQHGNPKKTTGFILEADRNDFAQTLAADFVQAGEVVFDPEKVRAWQQFEKDTGATLPELREAWSKWKSTKDFTLNVRTAADRYLEERAPLIEPDHYRHAKLVLKRFAAMFGNHPLATLDKDDVETWIKNLSTEFHLGPATIEHHRKLLHGFVSHAQKAGWCPANPCEDVAVPKAEKNPDDDDEGEIHVLTLRDAFTFFKANRDCRIVGKLALEAFVGLRVSSAHRLVEKEIDHEEKGIVLPAHKHKGRTRRYYLEGMPENAFAWLEHGSQACWEIKKSNYNRLKGLAFVTAGVINPHNVLRHSFCTYHIAGFGDVSKTALLLSHRNPTMLYSHYRGRGVPHKEGLAYFQITPSSTLLSWEAFATLHQVKP